MMTFLKRKSVHWLIQLAALLLGILVVLPIAYGICGAFKSPAEFAAQPPTFGPKSFANLDNFNRVMTQAPMLRYFFNSLVVATLTSLVRVLIAVLAAYALVFYEFPGKNFFFFLILGTMMLPADTLLVTNYQTVSRMGLTDTYLGMCITSFIGASQMFMLRQSFKTAPIPLREAALLDGCGDLRFIRSILVPVSGPVLLTLFIQSFVAMWNSYLWPLMITNHDAMRTVQVGITMLTTIEETNYEIVLAGVTLSLIPAFILFLILRKNLTRTITAGALVG